MFKKFIPFATAKSIYDIENEFFLKHGFKTIICDLDNTLDSYKELNPRQEAFDLVKRLKEINVELIIFSNNKEKRVKPYAEKLGVKYFLKMCKPLKFKAEKVLKQENLKKEECVVIGDQLFTDIRFSNALKVKGVFCDKIVNEDFWWTRFVRKPEKIVKKYLNKRNLLKNYKEV